MTFSTKSILYVDDDPDDREFLADAIATINPDIKVIPAENGIKALEYLDSTKNDQLPCVIILDLNMPFLNGRETFDRIRTNTALNEVPVVVLSSSEKPHDKDFFNNRGIEYFTKPTDILHLNDIASHVLSTYCREASQPPVFPSMKVLRPASIIAQLRSECCLASSVALLSCDKEITV